MMIRKFSKFCNKYNRVYKITIRSISGNRINKIIYRSNYRDKFFYKAHEIEDQQGNIEEEYQYLARMSDAYDNRNYDDRNTPLYWYKYRKIIKFSRYA